MLIFDDRIVCKSHRTCWQQRFISLKLPKLFQIGETWWFILFSPRFSWFIKFHVNAVFYFIFWNLEKNVSFAMTIDNRKNFEWIVTLQLIKFLEIPVISWIYFLMKSLVTFRLNVKLMIFIRCGSIFWPLQTSCF